MSHDPRFSLEQAWEAREERILSTFRAVRPDAVLVELFPFGRAKFARELVPLLEAARATGALTACSLRDILVSRRTNQRAHDERAARLAEAHLDAVLVHADPRFARLEETFSRPLAVPVHYTGFVVREPVPRRPRGDHVLVSAGGGLVGEPLLRAAAELDAPVRIVGGPLLPDDAWARLEERPGLELRRTVPDLGAELAGARASISQAGYNTTLEVVASGVPALLVPYATPEEDEQTPPRAPARAPRGRAGATVERLADALPGLLEFTPRPATVDLGGARRTAELVSTLLRDEAVA